MVKTNTFGANRLKFNDHTEFTLREVVEAAVANARQAAKEAGHGWIALDLGPTGRLLKPMGDLEFETAVSMYRETAQTGVQAGADLILIETMSDSYELKAAVLGAKEALESLGRLEGENRIPIFATVIFDGKGKLFNRRNGPLRHCPAGGAGSGRAGRQLRPGTGGDEGNCERVRPVRLSSNHCES